MALQATNRQNDVEKIFLHLIRDITGLDGTRKPLGTVRITAVKNETAQTIYTFFKTITAESKGSNTDTHRGDSKLLKRLFALYSTAKRVFVDYYSAPSRFHNFVQKFTRYRNEPVPERKARIATEIWAPELSIPEKDILEKWRLHKVTKAEHPITSDQLVIQLNALYTLPVSIPAGTDPDTGAVLKEISNNSDMKIADYDHPVPVFSTRAEHELILCLEELDRDIGFEKSIGNFAPGSRLPVVVSISVTHRHLDRIAERWVRGCIGQSHFRHLKVLLLSEDVLNSIQKDLLKRSFDVFSVQGQYARHFNTLKYVQLLLEKPYGIRAGFKLDTDEGIRSEDLFRATGKSWFQTLCHEYWGGLAYDWRGRIVYTGVNVGEYVNSSDIDALGFDKALREPDVKPPKTYISPDIFFNKAFAHSRTTVLYNRFDTLEEFVSHPVVKGGGFGIDNEGLRKYTPFTLSCVGRAEDQAFYFYGLSKGLRGIFHPDLRIAHYKNRFASSESKTEAQRFIGDMYRLVLFSHLVELLGFKDDIDPMPGIFAGGLAFCQAFFNMVYRAYVYGAGDNEQYADVLMADGLDTIEALYHSVQNGEIRSMLADEEQQWKNFVALCEKIDPPKTRRFFDDLFIDS